MDQKKHSTTQQEVRKPITKAAARHLRRKRLKDARRAEEQQYLNLLNGVSNHIQDGLQTNDATRDGASCANDESTSTLQPTALKLASAWDKPVFSPSANSANLSLSDQLNDLTISAILKKFASLENSNAKRRNLSPSHCSSNVANEAKRLNGAKDLPETTNGKKSREKEKRARSPVAGATESTSDSKSCVSNLNWPFNGPADGSHPRSSVENGQTSEQKVPVSVGDSEDSALDEITEEFIALNKYIVRQVSKIEHRVNCSSANNINDSSSSSSSSAVEASSGRSDSSTESKGSEEANVSSSTLPAASITEEETSLSPAKTREDMSPQRGTKKAAKMQANNGKAGEPMSSGNKSEPPSATEKSRKKSPRKSADAEAVKDVAASSQKTTDVVTELQSSQSARKTEPKQKTEENNVLNDSSAVSKSEESAESAGEPLSSSKKAEEKSSAPEEKPKEEVKAQLSSEKTKEEVKAEREAKKATKAAAKAKAKNKKTEEAADNVKIDTANEPSPAGSQEVSTESVTAAQHRLADAQSSQKTDVAAISSQGPQVTKEVEESAKENATHQLPNVQATSVESSVVVSRQDSAAPADGKADGKSKAELRAERRAKQEAQRAAKQLQQQSTTKQQQPSSTKSDARDQEAPSVKPRAQQAVIETAKKIARKDNDHEVNLFKHLYNERDSLSQIKVSVNSTIHPAIAKLGAQYEGRTIVGSNARCLALLDAVKDVIQDFVIPEQADFIRSLEVCLRDLLAYLHRARPAAVSMQNAMRHLKWHMTSIPVNMPINEAKAKLTSIIDTYMREQIELAGKAISITIQTKISNGNIILIYGFSSLIYNILVDAHAAGKQFRVIVVDGRPWLEGKEQLKRLAKHGIDCSYILINAVSFIMPEVSKVFLGAHAILANGAVMSRVGTSQIALIAKAFNVPVLVACETHKTCGRVQTDSIVYNELGNADDLVNSHELGTSGKSLLTNWRARKSLNLLNITYDVTPADLITAVVTELAILPCTSVPVILRIKPTEF